jgi:predicted NACHT family NTPase
MRVLDMTRPISLDNIYTDVNILQDVTGRRRLDLAELLKSSSLEEFNRLDSFHTRTDRRSGIQVVEEFDKLMLLGKPGAGKTTFLKRLATLCNKGTLQRHRVPVFITLKDFADKSKKPDLLTYIGQWLNEMGVQGAQATEHLLHHGRFFVLLDGLDEVSEVSSKSVLKEIQAFSNRFSQNAFVISCRIAAKEFTFQQFTEAEIADFNNARIADFATRWFQAKQSEEKINLFLGKLEANPPIKELATNPLLLTLLCLVFEGRTDFPSNRSELYKEGIDVLLKKWDGARCIERESVYRNLSLKRKEDLLSQIAFKTFDSGTFFFKQKEAERLIEQYIQNLPDAETDPEILQINSESVLKSIEAQHGTTSRTSTGIYSFSHLTFHEYFTSRYILERYELYQHLVRHLTEKRWREIFLLTVGMASKADSLLLLMKIRVTDY